MVDISIDSTLNCLIVDPHPLVCDALSGLLTDMMRFDKVFSINEIDESLQVVFENQIDIIIIDVDLVGLNIDGFDLLRKIRNNGYKGKVLFLTSSDDQHNALLAYQLGVHGCISKSSTLSFIREIIEKILQGHIVFNIQHLDSSPSIEQVKLSKREAMVLKYLLEGCRNKEISKLLSINPKTVSTYKVRILNKFKASSIVELAENKSLLRHSMRFVSQTDIS